MRQEEEAGAQMRVRRRGVRACSGSARSEEDGDARRVRRGRAAAAGSARGRQRKRA